MKLFNATKTSRLDKQLQDIALLDELRERQEEAKELRGDVYDIVTNVYLKEMGIELECSRIIPGSKLTGQINDLVKIFRIFQGFTPFEREAILKAIRKGFETFDKREENFKAVQMIKSKLGIL